MTPINIEYSSGMAIPDLSGINRPAQAYQVLNRSLPITSKQWGDFCENVQKLEAARTSGDSKVPAAAMKAFKKAHEQMLSAKYCDDVGKLIALKEWAQKPNPAADRPSGLPVHRRIGPPREYITKNPRSAKERLVNAFLRAYDAVPVGEPEAISAGSPLREDAAPPPQINPSSGSSEIAPSASASASVGAAPAAEPSRPVETPDPQSKLGEKYEPLAPSQFGMPLKNNGGGDCLFHAFMGKDLSEEEVIQIRGRIAEVLRGQKQAKESYNAESLATALMQTPEYSDRARVWVQGRHRVSNEVLAAFQAVPGMYAGEDELRELTRLDENQTKTVVVIDSVERPEKYLNGEKKILTDEELFEIAPQVDLFIYKNGAHWEQIKKPEAADDAVPEGSASGKKHRVERGPAESGVLGDNVDVPRRTTAED